MFALPLRHLLHDRFELALHLFEVLLDALALGLGQRLEHLGCEHLAVAPRRQRQPHRRAQHADAFLLGAPLQLAKGLLVALFELLVDDVAPRPVVVAFEGRRQGRAQLLDEPFHRLAQPVAATRRQLQAARLLRVGKVVDVAPVGRRRRARRPGAATDRRRWRACRCRRRRARRRCSPCGASRRQTLPPRPRGPGRSVPADPRARRPGRTAAPPDRRAGRGGQGAAGGRARRPTHRPRPGPARDG